MKRSIAFAWATFLENPHRKQAKGILDAGNGKRCPLGHLCYMLRTPRKKEIGYSYPLYIYADYHTALLPITVMNKAGMRSQKGALKGGGSISKMNDGGMSLKKIAKIIRKRWRDL